jgi:hypothetical protein
MRPITPPTHELSDTDFRFSIYPFSSVPPEFAISEGRVTLTFTPRSEESEVLVDALALAREPLERNINEANEKIREMAETDETVPLALLGQITGYERHLRINDEMRIRLRGGGWLLDESGHLKLPRPIEAPLPGAEPSQRPRLLKLLGGIASALTRPRSEPSPEEPAEPKLDLVVLADDQIGFVLDDLETAITTLSGQLEDEVITGNEAKIAQTRLSAMQRLHMTLLPRYISLELEKRRPALPPE